MSQRPSTPGRRVSQKLSILLTISVTLGAIAVPLLGNLAKFGAPRTKAPDGWTKFEWPQKKEVLFGHYAPTPEELALIDQALPREATAKPAQERRVLLFYKCDYPHTSIATGVATFEKMAKATGAFALDSTDDPAQFSIENLAKYDAILLNNTVGFENFLSPDQRSALLEFVKNGKGLIGIHAAADANKNWQEGADLIGGIFQCHPWTSKGEWVAKIESPLHPLNQAFNSQTLYLRDEIYLYQKDSFSRERSRVLLSLDMDQQRNFEGEGFAEKLRDLVTKDGDHPIAWLHEYGKGRVFYSNLGHNNFTYWNPVVLQHFLDGIQYALGDLPADATPSAEVTDPHTVKAESKRIVFLAGGPSHNSGDHEFRAGSLLLAKALNAQTDLPIEAEVISRWPEDDRVLNGADAIIIYADSDSVQRDHYKRLMEITKGGTGLFFMHYGVHPKKDESGQNYYLPTVGGYFKNDFSVNPLWVADFSVASDHPVRRGIEKPIQVLDEWYYHLQFDEKAIPLLTGVPTKETLITTNLWNKNGSDGLGKPQTVMWGFERPDGSRGGGYTGGHFHRNWAIDDLRKVVLNTIVWVAGLDVPEGGIRSRTPTEDEINANLDQKKSMTHIKLPLKKGTEYHAEIARNRGENRKKAEAKKAREAAAAVPKFRNLLDPQLTAWETWIGVPHKSVEIPGMPPFTSEDSTKGTPLGLNNDPLKVFSMIKEDGKDVLKITGQIYGGLTTKEEFENYHLTLQFKWGEKVWEPRPLKVRDSGVLLHCVGRHGAFWNVWKRCLECQIQERDVGDFYALAGTMADVPTVVRKGSKKPTYQPDGELREVSGSAQHGPSEEMPHGEWNTVEIYTIGDRMVHVVNGKVNMVLLNTRQKTAHGPAPLTKGQIQIQSEAAEIYYRDVKIRPITEFPEEIQAALPKR
ncbi:ThuA domain-containing protein [Verrucomicrobiaceae bacterium 227]